MDNKAFKAALDHLGYLYVLHRQIFSRIWLLVSYLVVQISDLEFWNVVECMYPDLLTCL